MYSILAIIFWTWLMNSAHISCNTTVILHNLIGSPQLFLSKVKNHSSFPFFFLGLGWFFFWSPTQQAPGSGVVPWALFLRTNILKQSRGDKSKLCWSEGKQDYMGSSCDLHTRAQLPSGPTAPFIITFGNTKGGTWGGSCRQWFLPCHSPRGF